MKILIKRNLKLLKNYSKKGKREDDGSLIAEAVQLFNLGSTKKEFVPRDEIKIEKFQHLNELFGVLKKQEVDFLEREIEKKQKLMKDAEEALPNEFLKEAKKPTLNPPNVIRLNITPPLPMEIWRPFRNKKN